MKHITYILKEINKIALYSNDDKRLQSFDVITSYPYGADTGKVCKTELLEYLNIRWLILMMLEWPYIPDHPYKILIVGSSGSGKANELMNVINNQSDIDKIYYT